MTESDPHAPQIDPALQNVGQTLFSEIRDLIDAAKQRAAIAINTEINALHP
jgi:hypothetical protein